MPGEKRHFGIMAEYDSPRAIYHACEQIRDAGYRRFDAFTPFPVHGLERAMGLGPSYLPWLVLFAGIAGAFLAMLLMVWTAAYDYPLNIGGKPTFSIPAFIPITFEVTILFSGLTAVFGMFFLNGLPRYHDPLFEVARFARATDDRFFVVIEARDKRYDQLSTTDFLIGTGAVATEVVEV